MNVKNSFGDMKMKHVNILLSTYNGEKFLREQIQSLLEQQEVHISIFVRDDGSTDGTQQILQEYQKKGMLKWYTGANLTAPYSFLDLVYKAPESEYYAFCDQDDVWLNDKLQIAVECLNQYSQDRPALYYGRARLVNQNLQPIEDGKTSPDKMLDFKSAVINSNATGCTMVFNKALLEVVREKQPSCIAMHDGWIHKVCIIMKGNIYFDEDVHILYRQHGGNVIGSSNSKWRRIKRHYASFRKKDCIRSKTICSLLECYGDVMDPEEYEICKLIAEYKESIANQLKILFRRDIRTDYIRRNILFRMAIVLRIF